MTRDSDYFDAYADDWPEEEPEPLPRLQRLWSLHAAPLSERILGQIAERCECPLCRVERLKRQIDGLIAEREAREMDQRRRSLTRRRLGLRDAAWRIGRRRGHGSG